MFDADDLARLERRRAGRRAEEGAILQIDRWNRPDQVRDAEFAGDRAGDEAVGGGDDGAQVAGVEMFADQGARRLADDRADVAVHEFRVPGVEFLARMAGQWRQLEFEESADVERAGLVVFVELDVLRCLQFAVDNALGNQELRPLEIGVAGEKGVVEVEESEVHASCSRESSSRSRGSVTGRFCSRVYWSRATTSMDSVRMSREAWRSR
ncbi:hypothetical protein SDC9_156402 [bioreactor metagenome]|uniref:Uncharacterized protein n=1 Tax=bioreactor metagenome TaxID=1076179 RepID=A0A645F952_9ZZZZ